MTTGRRMTGRDLLMFLKSLTPEQLRRPVGTTGHYGEFYDLHSPVLKLACPHLEGKKDLRAIILTSDDPHYPESD